MRTYHNDPDQPSNINYNRFKPNGGDYDEAVFCRSFSGRITKARYKILYRFCRANSGGIPIYSDYDCTGRVCGRYFEFEYKHNRVTVKLRVAYDV